MTIQVVTAGRHGTKMWTKRVGKTVLSGAIYGVKVYEARLRKADGTMTWRLIRVLPETFTVENTAAASAMKFAEQNNLPYLPGVRHGARMKQVIA